MKKIIFIFTIIFTSFVLSSCTRYPDEDWRITNEELFKEYYQKYIDYAIEVVDSYDLEYEYTIELVEPINRHIEIQYFQIVFEFEDSYQLHIVFGHHDYKKGYIVQILMTDADEFEELNKINYNYFKIMHKINQFSTYNLHGDVDTYINLFNEMLEDNGISKSYYYHKEPYDGYYVHTYYENNIFQCSFYFHGRLTDKNIWDENIF
ncbi:MAG: hypothetical protein M0Q88_07385 [Bacilli bacterium]|nr:hypothetical protein [Bacilli bacterium]